MSAIVYFHGGGHVIGSLDTHDFVTCNLCGGTGAVVASVDYRMGPEHQFPAAVDDCFATLQWVHPNAVSLGADPARIGVHGDNAGAVLRRSWLCSRVTPAVEDAMNAQRTVWAAFQRGLCVTGAV